MTIHVGDRIPEVTLKRIREGIETLDTHSLFDARKVVLFAVPGAFTPTCSARHLPGYVEKFEAFRQRGPSNYFHGIQAELSSSDAEVSHV